MSLALTPAWYIVSNAATVCASRVGGGFGKANGGAVSDRRESSGGVGIGTIVLLASGCLACCSDVRVAVCSGARVAVCCGTAVGVSCAAGEGLCSGAGVGVGVAGAGLRSRVGVAVCCVTGLCSACGGRFTGLLPPLTKVACNLFPLASTYVTAPFNLPRTILPE